MKPGFFLRQRVLGYYRSSITEVLPFWEFKYMRLAVVELDTPQAKRLAETMHSLMQDRREMRLTKTLAFNYAKRMVEEYLNE